MQLREIDRGEFGVGVDLEGEHLLGHNRRYRHLGVGRQELSHGGDTD